MVAYLDTLRQPVRTGVHPNTAMAMDNSLFYASHLRSQVGHGHSKSFFLMQLPLRDWLLRYGPAEVAGITLAFVASFAVRHTTHSAILGAYAAAWGETIGYASVMGTRDLLAQFRQSRRRGRKAPVRDAGSVATDLLAEFGPAGVIDTFVTRPFMMAVGVKMLGAVVGLVFGKITADLLFYGPVVYMYERRKRRR